MKTPLFWLSLLAVLISCGGTPNQKPTPIDPDPKVDPIVDSEPAAPSVVGTVNLSLSDSLAAQGTLIEPTGITFTRTARALVTDTKRNTRYINATFKVSNNTGATLTNLRVYAVNTANNLSGTALFGLQNHSKSGLLRGDFARVTQPGHTMNEVSGGAATINTTKANMILLTTGDAAGYAVTGTTTLQYGFRTTETSIANNTDGTMNISYRLPVTSSNTDDIGFSATFIVVKDGPNQVAQSPDESLASVKARASAVGATELIYIGPSGRSSDATKPAGVNVLIPLDNPQIGIGTPAAYLLPNYQYASFNTTKPDQGGSVTASTTGPANACAGTCTASTNARSSGQPNTVKVTTAQSSTATISTTAPGPQYLADYKKLKVFVEVSNASKTEIVIGESPSGGLRYPIDASSAKTHTIDLSAPACLSAGTCTSAQVKSGLDKVTRIDLQIESNSATGASLEYGDLLLTDYQP
jgi:hypothetical protein